MNSQIKNALTDFIKSNKAAVEQEMENGEDHDLDKREPTIPDLVNYLACPTPQSTSKDAQPMSLEDKVPIHDPNFNPAQQQQQSQQHQQKVTLYTCPNQQHQAGYPSPSQNQQQLSQPGDGNHFGTSGESSFGVGENSSPKVIAHPQHQHEFLQQHQSHYSQNTSYYASQHNATGNGSSGSTTTSNSANAEKLMFSEMPSSETPGYGHTSNTAANAGSSLNNFNGQPSLSDQFQTNVPAQHHNPVVSYQGQAQVNTSSYQSNAVLPSSFAQSSPNTHLQSSTFSFDEMTLPNHGTVGLVEGTQNQFKSTEKMHVDEPVSGYSTNPRSHAQNISHFQQQNFQTKPNSMEVSFNTENFSGNNTGFSLDQFDSSLVDKPLQPAPDYGNSNFENAQFSSQSFTQESTLAHQNQQMGIRKYQSQPTASQNTGNLSLHASQYVNPKPGLGHTVSNKGQSGFSNNNKAPFHNAGFQESNSPVVSNVASPTNDNFHAHASNIDSPHTPTYNKQSQVQGGNDVETQQFQPHISHQPSPAEEQLYAASPLSNNSDATIVLSPGYSAAAFQNNAPSPDNYGGQFLSHQQQHEQRQQQQQQHHQQQQQHQQQQRHQQQQHRQQNVQLHQQNFLNNAPQQHTNVIRNDNFMTPNVNKVATQQAQLASNSNLQYHSAAVNQDHIVDTGIKPSILDNFSVSNNSQFSTQTNFASQEDSFAHIDFESLASEEFNVKGSVASNQISLETQNFNYQYSNANSPTATRVTAEGSQANFPFSQNDKSLSSEASCLATAGPGQEKQVSSFQARSAEINLQNIQNTHQENQEKFPQPMQVQDNVFTKNQDTHGQLTYQAPEPTFGETEMDTSTGLVDKSQNLTQGMSYEEIHSSIVEAGKEFSRKAADAGNFPQQKAFESPRVQLEAGTNVATSLNCHDLQTNNFFQTSPHAPKTEALFISLSQPSSMASSVGPSSLVAQNQLGVNFQQISSASSFGLQTSFPSSFGNIQPSSSATGSQLPNVASSQVFSQLNANETTPIVTMPNFLENPGAMLSCIRASNPENVSMLSPLNFQKPEQAGLVGTNNGQMVMTMIAASPVNSLPVVAKSGTDHPKMAAISSQQHVQQPPLSLGSVYGINPQFINSVASVVGSLTVSQGQQQQPVSLGLFSQLNNQQPQVQLAQGLVRTEVGATTASTINGPNGVAFQLMPSQANPNPPALTLGVQSNYSKPVNQTVSSTLPAGTMAVVGGQQSMSQPHIVITLEDLKKLLSQRSPALSPTSSESKPAQAQQTVANPSTSTSSASIISSSPMMLSQTMSPLRLIQPPTQQPPRLFFNTPPRLMHPHEQLQQTREKLQQLMQQAQQSQTFPTGLPAHKNQEHTILFASEESNNQQKVKTSILTIQQDQQANHKMQIIQQMQVLEQHKQIQEQMHIQQQQQQQHKPQLPQKHAQDTLQNIVFTNKDKSSNDLKLPPLQLPCNQSGQRLIIQHSQFMQVSDQKAGQQSTQGKKALNLNQMQQEFQAPKSIDTPTTEYDKKSQQPTEKVDRPDRLCSDSLKKDYKQLHSLLTMDSSTGNPINRSPFSKAMTTVGQLGQVSDGSLSSHLPMAISSSQSKTLPLAISSGSSASPSFTLMPLSTAPPLSLSSSCSTFLPAAKEGFSFKATASSFPPPTSGFSLSSHANSAPLTTLAFANALSTSAFSKVSEMKETNDEAKVSPNTLPSSTPSSHSDSKESEMAVDVGSEPMQRQGSILAQILTENKRSHSPLSVDLSSPANSNSEAPSPLSSPNPFEDSNTQLTLVERSADLHIKSDTMHGIDDDDGEDTFSDSLYKRPSTEEPYTSGESDPNVPMKIAKASSSMDARSSIPTPSSPEPAFDMGSVVSSTSNFSFAFSKKKETGSEVFTFGSNSTSCSTSESFVRRSPKPAVSKPVLTQSVRPIARKQKEYGLKAYYPSKCEDMELKILEQPEAQHRARYQTEGSRGAIKDASQQGFPVIKLSGYNKKTKLQIYIGDESARVKPHGFYQACRVFGKNSTPCTEQEIEGTAVIEIDLTPENDMTAKLDCIGILKLRNADVERRIGPKRARDKKKNNTRARLVMRCLVERQNNRGELMLQIASNAIVCTQPVGQPEICRMSLNESSVKGGESLFIIGKNFKNKGTTVSFQLIDPNDESVVLWQAGAEIEQEFFQPTHLICKIPQFMDTSIQKPQTVQITVSCAGKKSDPHKFTYKPETKQEVPMDTDNVSSSRSLSFVSPEALQLNHMVHQSHALSLDSNRIFQLPPGAVPTVETQTNNVLGVKPGFKQATSGLIKPARLVVSNSVSDTSSASAWSPSALTLASTIVNSSLSSQVSVSPFKLYGDVSTPTSQATSSKLPTFLLDEKPDGFVSEDIKQSKSSSTSKNQDISFNCIVHSTSRTQPIPSPSHTVSSGHDGTTLTSSAHASSSNMAASAPSSETQKTVATSPIVVLLDPAALQNTEGNEQIQQLLQQFINSQNR